MKPRQAMHSEKKSADGADRTNPALMQALQEDLRPIEPPPEVQEDLFKRILKRTVGAVRTWRGLMQRSKERMDD
jgi:hypothetical protein